MDHIVRLRGVVKHYPPEQIALKNIDLSVAPGEFLFVAGASGAGKSTLLKILFGAERATSGEVLITGRNLMQPGEMHIAPLRRDIGFVFQDYKLLPRRTVVDNVTFGLEVMGVAPKERELVALKLLKAIGLEDKVRAYPQTLSGGEQQRVAIARALIHRPKILIADEPTGNLDREMTRIVFELLMEANRAGVTVVVATHDLAMIEELNMRTVVLDKGRIIGDFESLRRGE
jgi:cell division transport system ATP-binding protein